MASNHPLSLMNIPLEVRHLIFSYVAASDKQPELVLKYWFERKEVGEKRRLVEGSGEDKDEDEDEDEDEDDSYDGEGYEDEEEIEEDSEHEEGEAGEDDGTAATTTTAAVLANVQGSTAADQTVQSTVADASISGAYIDPAAAMATAATTIAAPTAASDGPSEQDQDYVEAEVAGADMDDDAEEHAAEEDEVVDSEGNADSDDEEEDGEEDEEEDEEEYTAMQLQTLPVITAHSKWRHIPKFMRITLCPPPVELLLASKDLNNEAKSWFYDVAVLHIEATGSFAHTSFFEEAFRQTTEAEFSPMGNIRKVEVTFVWDSTWLRSDRADCAAAVFPALLRQRALFVTGILARAPQLSQVIIHWHDSAQDEEAVDLMNDVLSGFLSLPVAVKVETHYIATDAKPYKKSVAGRRRVEFQRIVDNGLDRLF